MALRPIVKYPDERLKLRSKEVTDPAAYKQLVEDMSETMYAASGAGLAAIQVGEPVRLFLIDAAIAGGQEEDPPLVFFNPEIIELSKESETADEGCLSFPTVYVPVKRSLWAKVRALDLQGKPFEMEGEGLFARAIQHETDHLNGRVLADYVGRIKRQLITRKLARVEAEEDD